MSWSNCDVAVMIHTLLSTAISFQEELEKECPDILKLGLLNVLGAKRASARGRPTFLSFEHKSLQEFGASKFVAETIETSTNIKVLIL